MSSEIPDWAVAGFPPAGHFGPPGGGARLFDGVGPGLRLDQVRAVEAPAVTHLSYRVVT